MVSPVLSDFWETVMTDTPAPKRRILLADDDPDVRDIIKTVLELDRYQVTTATNGREALDQFAPGRFAVVITDYLMPEMTGDKLALAIKALAADQPVVMVTAHAASLPQPIPGVDALVMKPFDLPELRAVVNRLC
jgi:CheY-like chemotaxis protein